MPHQRRRAGQSLSLTYVGSETNLNPRSEKRIEPRRNRIVVEANARESRPVDCVITYLVWLRGFAALIVKPRDALSRSRQAGDDESYAGVLLAGVQLDASRLRAGACPRYRPGG